MARKLILGAAVAAFLIVPVAVKFGGGKPKHEAELANVARQEIRPSILATGNLVFRQEVQLSAEVIGKVAAVLVKEGDRVERAQPLLRLDPTVYVAEVKQQEASRRNAAIAIERAQINLDTQQRNLERTQRLYQDKFIDISRYDDAVHQVDLAKVELRASRETLEQASAQLAQAKEHLAKTEVRAPIDGTVTAVPIKIGETAVASATGIAGSSLMTIADVGSIMAEVNVDEADIARVAKGQQAKVFPAAFPNQPVTGTVESVAMAPKGPTLGAAASQGKSYVVKLHLDDAKLALRSGMTCRVEIVVGSSAARPAVPLQAVLSEESGGAKERSKNVSYVFTVVDGKAKKQLVELGLSDDANQEIIKGLAVGDTIAVGPARVLRELHDGDLVVAKKAELKVAGAGK
ncbi:efflux RND transporter periplasmic adaptor subunit [Massilia terrae]|uniref:Efflux RND transporter periplasmic adaptor subunit n=1 Tax=Massilia terrae TaxID=1811224 RepID=A0ABT2CSJ2_9BURK|nr:efflux RND transporter periplasmic adaptor subunit [Massilia terrae]MCS0656937.1 efflux RND transporter periplasmic adaptor subunit [Massilia terrae]